MKINKLKGNRSAAKWSLVLGLLLLMVAGISQAVTQQDRKPAGVPDTLMADLMKMKGTVLSEGRNTQPVGALKLLTYRVEELSLPRTVTVDIAGKAVQVDKAWRVTITGGPFPVRALPPVIWIDDVAIGSGAENENLSEISVITFDRSTLREGLLLLSLMERTKSRAMSCRKG